MRPVRRMHEAMLYDKLGNGRVRCRVCSHGCTIESGARGVCAVRENVDGKLVSLAYSRLIARSNELLPEFAGPITPRISFCLTVIVTSFNAWQPS